jgi:catechol 2,3-dioxygenase-like lactoylglutathione lyase family enzyme
VLVGLDHVQVAAPPGCEAAARRFYGELLGLAEVAKPAALASRGGVWFAVGAQQLHVGVDAEFVPARKAHPALAARDGESLHALAERLTKAGVAVQWDALLEHDERFYVDDPRRNRVEITAV